MRRLFGSTGHDSPLWPVLLLLLIVLVPSAGVVWMMRAAMENERLAVRQRLADAYRAQLEIAKGSVAENWQQQLAELDSLAEELSPPMLFAACAGKFADAVIVLDANGKPVYPSSPDSTVGGDVPTDPQWQRAERLEFVDKAPDEAAEIYRDLALQATDVAIASRARQAQARALANAGDVRGAIRVLQLLRASDSAVAADAELRLLELLDADSPEWTEVAATLTQRLNNYDTPLPPDRRRFLMHSYASLDPDAPLPTLAAEDLAAEYLSQPAEPGEIDVLQPTAFDNLWHVRSPSGHVVALYTSSTLKRQIGKVVAGQPFPENVNVALRGPGPADRTFDELAGVSLAPTMPGWRLSLALADSHQFDAVANDRVVFLLWTAGVVIALTAALALLVAGALRRQQRLTRLKNDLVATVSHELKTPLASIRLLVDTLLDADGSPDAPFGDQARAREYLEMISKENTRLSRLIDNFLTFSRMERGKHRFDFEPTDAAAIVEQASAAVAERFDGTNNKLSVNVERQLPLVGDVDALVTVVVNLLDNAWKYSDVPRNIAVAAERHDGRIMISVADNGIGLSPRAVRKVFDRFYQVDQHLSRSHDGCGLGLSIVKYVVEAHGGEVSAESQLGSGSKFTVSLPANGAL